ncbi:hypothetical protein [Pontibacter cellulosilyticus]|uniref:Uncharacterized protein n=1 Tax=Pontibacter cellulosilyticus TaxID=1720253 RepID=A0A923SNZ9_9BACT|nr:hypothetical protein [Pontibacter cellulosilyticus]MBC5993685.1 hypothetical protein [Pontibacter cellulosilyticus]
MGKDSNIAQPALPAAGNSEKRRDLKLRLQLMVNALAVAACFMMIFYTSDVMINELSKALGIVLCLNMFRVMASNNTSTEKQL